MTRNVNSLVPLTLAATLLAGVAEAQQHGMGAGPG